MKTEKELFEEWVAKNIADGNAQSWEEWCWEAWQASVSREGYRLAPVEPTLGMLKTADEHIMDRNATAESVYKAMINAI